MIISLDLDGTLLNSNTIVPKSTIEYLEELKSKGEIIVINTGRAIHSALDVTNGAYFANYIISDTGAIIYDVVNKSILKKNCIDIEIGKKIFEMAKDDSKNFRMFTSQGEYEYQIDFEQYNELINHNTDIYHISFDGKDQEFVQKFEMENKDKFKNLKIFAMVDSFGTEKWIEVISKEAGKLNGLRYIQNMLKLDRDNIIAFGDAINDVEVISYAGMGVAMRNAIPEVKENARFVTEFSNNECGVEMWLKKQRKI